MNTNTTGNTSPTLTTTDNVPFNVKTTSGLPHLVEVHQTLTDYLRFQSHTQLDLLVNPPEFISEITHGEKRELLKGMTREEGMLRLLKDLINQAEVTIIEMRKHLKSDHGTGSEWGNNDQGWD